MIAGTQHKQPPPPCPGSVERRRHERYPLLAQVELQANSEILVLEAHNISMGGMYLAAGADDLIDVSRGDRVELYLDLGVGANGRRLELRANARVVRVEDGSNAHNRRGIAVLWTGVSPSMGKKLGYVIEQVSRRSDRRI